MKSWLIITLVWLLLPLQPIWAEEAPASAPPGINVHLVVRRQTGTLWRGAGPRRDTVLALRDSAKARKVKLMLIDLRHPATTDDVSGKDGRLSPQAESQLAQELGINYRSISAMDNGLPAMIAEALRHGDVYIHCMYGVNRTGFAVGRYATADRIKADRQGLGEKDWLDGVHFQQRLEKR